MAGLLLFGEAAAAGKQQQQLRRISSNSMPVHNYILRSTMPQKTGMSIMATRRMTNAIKASCSTLPFWIKAQGTGCEPVPSTELSR